MIRRYIPTDQSNKSRVWPCKAESGIIVSVPCDRVTFTHEDLSGWVEKGLLHDLGPVEPPSDQLLMGAQEAAEPAPGVEAAVEPEPAEAADESSEDPADEEEAPSGPSREDLESLNRSDLWAMLQERGLDSGLSYRRAKRDKMIDMILSFGGE